MKLPRPARFRPRFPRYLQKAVFYCAFRQRLPTQTRAAEALSCAHCWITPSSRLSRLVTPAPRWTLLQGQIKREFRRLPVVGVSPRPEITSKARCFPHYWAVARPGGRCENVRSGPLVGDQYW